jgi:hypothetical protein
MARRRRRRSNPIDTHTRDILIGTALLGVGGVALYAMSQSMSTGGGSNAVSFTPADANTTTPVKVGNTVTFSLPLSSGQSWQAVVSGDSILSATPTTQTSSTGQSDTYTVIAAGSAQVGYQLFDSSNNPVGSPLDFQLTAS